MATQMGGLQSAGLALLQQMHSWRSTNPLPVLARSWAGCQHFPAEGMGVSCGSAHLWKGHKARPVLEAETGSQGPSEPGGLGPELLPCHFWGKGGWLSAG